MLLVLRSVVGLLPTTAAGARVLCVPDGNAACGLPLRLLPLPPPVVVVPPPAAAAAALALADGRTLNVAPPTTSLTTAMLFSVSVPVLSLRVQRVSSACVCVCVWVEVEEAGGTDSGGHSTVSMTSNCITLPQRERTERLGCIDGGEICQLDEKRP